MIGIAKVKVIPYKDFWEKIRLVAYYAYEVGAKVEILDGHIYVEYREELIDEDDFSSADIGCSGVTDSAYNI